MCEGVWFRVGGSAGPLPVPGELAKTGGVEWNASVIYWFGVVDRCTQWWRKERRMVLVGDETLYVACPAGRRPRQTAAFVVDARGGHSWRTCVVQSPGGTVRS